VIIASAFLQDVSVNFCIDNNIPLVTVNRSIKEGYLIHQVMDDENHGIQLAIGHLVDLGHTHIAHIAGPQDILQGIKRKEAFIQHCHAQNIQVDIIDATAFTVEAGNRAAQHFVDNKCEATAIIAGNDLIAVGAIQHLLANNINVPKQVSVVGYNGMPFAEMLSPALTTVAMPAEQMGQQAARLLLNAIEDQDAPKQKVLLAPKLEVRQSTAPPLAQVIVA
jgi:LacI family transcriptional regulator